jgi:hypothetical protein
MAAAWAPGSRNQYRRHRATIARQYRLVKHEEFVMSTQSRSTLLRGAGAFALAAAVVLPLTVPSTAHAWWRGGWGWGGGIYIAPPVVVAPAPVYAPPPAYYAPPAAYYAPGMVWFGPGWVGGAWVPGHWGWRR